MECGVFIMKIMTWNCNGRFRDKIDIALACKSDLYVIQECENPLKYEQSFVSQINNYIWYGLNDNRGLCIFGSKDIDITDNNWEKYGLRHFVSAKINNRFDLIGVWASPPYIEEYYVYQQIHKDKFSNDTVIIGDFNSNAIWDNNHRERNHSEVVRQLNDIGLVSAYHYTTNEEQGKELTATFYLHRNTTKAYHIDYCFIKPERIRKMEILDKAEWLKYSDHIPLIVEIV